MAEINASLIQKLRKMTGVGMTQCKAALQESGGDLEEAVTYLRKAGLAAAAKKEGREAKEGKIGIAENEQAAVLVEVNAETDFVANNARFVEFLENVAEELLNSEPESLDAFLNQPYSKDKALSVEEYRATVVQSIGENLQVKRFFRIEKKEGRSLGIYSHMQGKIVSLVEISGSEEVEELAKNLAMHVAASAPEYISADQVPESVIEKEKQIGRSQHQNKPEAILEKILTGVASKFLDQVCLLRQPYVRDDSITVSKLLEQRAKETGKPLEVTQFVRWCVGE